LAMLAPGTGQRLCGSNPSAAEAARVRGTFIAALEALRHPKTDLIHCVKAVHCEGDSVASLNDVCSGNLGAAPRWCGWTHLAV